MAAPPRWLVLRAPLGSVLGIGGSLVEVPAFPPRLPIPAVHSGRGRDQGALIRSPARSGGAGPRGPERAPRRWAGLDANMESQEMVCCMSQS